jgi:hypothetical protein
MGTVGIAVVLATATVVAGPAPAQAIHGGVAVTDGRYPFAALIQVGETYACGATVVDPLWLLTATSCLAVAGQAPSPGPPAHPVVATVGRADLNSNAGQVLPVVEVQPHPQRGVTLLRLAGPVTAAPAVLTTAAPAVGATLRAAGFGRTGPTALEWRPNLLQAASFTVRSVGDGTVDLTGVAGSTTVSLCKGDAGDPVFSETGAGIRLVAVATASWQTGCGDPAETREGAVGARVDDLGGWIGQTVNHPYLMRNLGTDKCVDLPGMGLGHKGGSVSQYDCVNSVYDNQQWFFDARGRASDGAVLYAVRNAVDNLCLDLPGYGAPSIATAVSEFYCAGSDDNQWFRLQARPSGGVWLVNDSSGLCLDLYGVADHTNGVGLSLFTCSDQDDHNWSLQRADWTQRPATQGYLVANDATGQCVDIPDVGPGYVGGNLYQFTCIGGAGDNQMWLFDPRGTTADGQVLFAISNAKDHLCVDPPGVAAVQPGTLVVEGTCGNASDNQYFRLVPSPTYLDVRVVNDRSGLCLDVTPGGPLGLATCGSTGTQSWDLRP